MKNQKLKKIDPNRCNKKLLELSQSKINNDWVNRSIKKWKQDTVVNKLLIEGTDTFYTYTEYKYARIIAGYLPNNIPECWRVKCVVESYNELYEIDKDKKEAKKNGKEIKDIKEEKKSKYDFKSLRRKKK